MNNKQVGRPKLYGTASEKIGAFRKRLESSGYMRKEILMTEETWQQVTTLAKENGVSVSDAASGLLEFGMQTYLDMKESSPVSYSRKQVTPGLLTAPDRSAGIRNSSANPIADFFKKRREIAKSTSSVVPDSDKD